MRLLACWVFLGGLVSAAAANEPLNMMVDLSLDGRRIEGMPVRFDDRSIHLLARDGRLWEFKPSEAKDYRQSAARFKPYSTSELRAILLRDVGSGFEVTGTSHTMIAHASGERDKWAERFENLYRSFVHYFSVRGIRLESPMTPLLGVVCRDRREFDRYAAKQGLPPSSGVTGWYDASTNRITVYDMGGNDRDWQENASVIIHEATHQLAFNTGIHSRYTMPPRWVAEGLATMFEAPGVYDSRNHRDRKDRINFGRAAPFIKSLMPQHKPELIQVIVRDDRLFASNPGAAYAEAWALTFYLMETMPEKYGKYLQLTAQRPPFTDYTPKQRQADFTSVFGNDWRMFEAQFLRFIGGLDCDGKCAR